ncbi:MAG: ABC transporter ATP-binding protein [Candidatus Izemoplasmatales bacterium]|nr:ABC transporter ATP-binding protein [Candidatus Izemoplasmatales bacterium]
MMVLIKASKLEKEFNSQAGPIKVLTNINLTVQTGEFVGVVGPSGSGKSTLLYVLSGLEKASAGEILLFGEKVGSMNDIKMNEIRREKIGFVFQFYNLLPNLTVLENVELPLVIKKSNDLNKASEILYLVGLDQFASFYPSQLSGGMQQRVAIARAMVTNPKILFADEPTGNLDHKSGTEIMKILKRLNQEQKVTIVLVTHNLDHVAYCTRKLELIDGTIGKDERVSV